MKKLSLQKQRLIKLIAVVTFIATATTLVIFFPLNVVIVLGVACTIYVGITPSPITVLDKYDNFIATMVLSCLWVFGIIWSMAVINEFLENGFNYAFIGIIFYLTTTFATLSVVKKIIYFISGSIKNYVEKGKL